MSEVEKRISHGTSSRDDFAAATASPRCRSGRHIFEPFTPSDDLGGGAQRCECGKLLIDRTLGGGRVVEIDDGVLRGR